MLRAIHGAGCGEAKAKWPNDILWRGKKLAGILCEMEAEADVVHGVIVGIGVNANVTAFPGALKRTAASLCQALGRPVSVPCLTAEILNRLDEEYGSWSRAGLQETARFLNRHSMLAGLDVTIALTRDKIGGRVEGITDSGLLRLVQPDGTVHNVTSGEVCLCRPAAMTGKDTGL